VVGAGRLGRATTRKSGGITSRSARSRSFARRCRPAHPPFLSCRRR
jgi:hypothetical protein